MAKKRSKSKNKYAKTDVTSERIEELMGNLAVGSLGQATEGEFVALVAAVVGRADVASLVSLSALAQGKTQRKAVNQALYKLKQRGLEVPETKERKAPIKILGDAPSIEGLPILMSAPHGNSMRLLFFPYIAGRALWFVQADLKEPVGLESLTSKPSSRSAFKLLLGQVQSMPQNPDEGPPPFVQVEPEFLERKLWEIGELVRAGRTSSRVDHETTAVMTFPKEAPPHPARALTLDDVTPHTVLELDQVPFALAPVMHEAMMNALEAKIDEIESGVLVLSDAQKSEQIARAEEKLVDEWLANWTVDAATEVMLDAAYFEARAGRTRVAKAYLEAVPQDDDPARERKIAGFLTRVIAALRSGDGPTRDTPEPSSGIILPG